MAENNSTDNNLPNGGNDFGAEIIQFIQKLAGVFLHLDDNIGHGRNETISDMIADFKNQGAGINTQEITANNKNTVAGKDGGVYA